MALDLDALKNLPPYQKMALAILAIVVIVGAFAYLVYIPKNNEINGLKSQITHLTQEINRSKVKVQRLEAIKKEHGLLQQQLMMQMRQLPPEAEVPALLKQVSDVGTRIGLDFKLWRPTLQQAGPEGLYNEVPVDVEVAGGYHSIAMFFDQISKLPRIVNVVDIKMGKAAMQRNSVQIQTTFRAIAFALPPPGSQPESTQDKKGKKGKKGAKG